MKWADKKTKNARESMKKIFQNIHEHFQKRNNSSDPWNKNKKDKDSWE